MYCPRFHHHAKTAGLLIMNMAQVKEIKEVYELKMREERYENDATNDIYRASSDAIRYQRLVGTDTDTLAFGEFARRFERAIEDLETLIG